MTAALTLAIVGMLAGACAAQVGTWEAEQEDGRLTLHLGGDGSLSASSAIWMEGDTLIVEYSGTWEADGTACGPSSIRPA